MTKSLPVIALICMLVLTACQPKTVTINDESPNKKVNITVTANRTASLEPWKVQINVKAYDFKPGSLEFEIESGDINDKTVKFDWKDDRNCVISIDQPDGKPRSFQLIADAGQVQLAEINL
jgi:hypothetical protein